MPVVPDRQSDRRLSLFWGVLIQGTTIESPPGRRQGPFQKNGRVIARTFGFHDAPSVLLCLIVLNYDAGIMRVVGQI